MAESSGTVGVVVQTGGMANLDGNVILGFATGAEGQYDLLGSNSASLKIGGNLDIAAATGSSGSFYFNYDVATSTAGGNATLSFSTTGSQLIVGDKGSASFTQGAGDLNLAGQGITLDIGLNAGSNGAYYLLGGTLEDDQIVGDAGTGLMSNTGGTQTVNGNLIVGNQSTGVGTYTLGGTGNLTLATAGANITLGNAAGAQGTFNYNLTSGDTGTITFGTGQQIIVGASGSGTFNQGGGDLNLRDNGVGIDIAQNANSFGNYEMLGGTLETLGLTVGDAGSGQLNQSGGTITVGSSTLSENLTLGNQTGSSGVASIYGTNPNLTVWENATIGNNGYGKLQEATGVVDVKGSMTIANSAAGGEVDITGGSLTVGDGAAGNQLLVTSHEMLGITDNGVTGANVTVDAESGQ